jgi:hypothetical protein
VKFYVVKTHAFRVILNCIISRYPVHLKHELTLYALISWGSRFQ